MPTQCRLVTTLILCVFLVGCNQPTLTPGVLSPVPSDPPLPTATPDFSGAEATLTIVRTFPLMIGDMTVTAAIPLLFAVDEKDPEQPVIVWGTGAGTATMDSGAKGTGGSYSLDAVWPVEYEVKGVLTPSREVCRLSLEVDEALILSKEVIVHSDALGDMPLVAGEDEFTTFVDLHFTEIDNVQTRQSGTGESVFTIDDWCMPKATFCTYGCTP